MPAKKRATRSLEEDIEFSNITKFRSSLLGAVERIQRNPAKRYVITKLGEPEAVLMSYQTYSLLTKVMDQTLEGTAGQVREEAIPAAFARLRRDQQSAVPAPEPTTAVEAETYRDASREFSAIIDKVQAIRRQFDELDYTLKRQDQTGQTTGAIPVGEK